MHMSEQLLEITCDFTAPEVVLDSFVDPETSEPLSELLKCESVQLLHKAQSEGLDDIDALAELEQLALYDGIEAVRACVKYEPGKKPWQEQPTGDCFTYTWLISDVATTLGFDNKIAFCNGHAFNLIATPSGKFHMISGETKPMWLFDVLGNVYGKDALPDLTNLFSAASSLEYYSMYTRGLEAYSERIHNQGKKLHLPWVGDDLPAAAVMDPDTGKQALFTYTCFQSELYCSSPTMRGVRTSLNALRGINPQVETRERINDDLRQFRRLVKAWTNDSSLTDEQIVDCIAKYTAIMPDTKSMNIFEGDCLRIIGTVRQHVAPLELAAASYQAAARKTKKTDTTLLGKINANNQRLNEFNGTSQ